MTRKRWSAATTTSRLVIESLPREDGRLSVVRVEPNRCILSNGEELIVRYQKEQTLVEELCQERAAVTYRPWETADGVELVEIHRIDVDAEFIADHTVTEWPF